MDTNKTIIEKNILELFSFENFSDEEKVEFIDRVGSVILDSAALRFSVEANEGELEALGTFLESHAEEENVFEVLQEKFEKFTTILEEEALEFKKEAVKTLGS